MADDVQAPAQAEECVLTPEEQRAAELREKRCRNLLPPAKKGEVRNPTGANGRTQRAALVRWLEEKSKDGILTRIERVWQATYLAAIQGSAPDRKTLIEQHGGKPRQQVDLSSSDGSMSPIMSLTSSEQRALLERLMSEPEDGKEPDGTPGAPQG